MEWQRKTRGRKWPDEEGRYLVACRPYFDKSRVAVIEAYWENDPAGGRYFYSEDGSIGELLQECVLDWMPMPVYEVDDVPQDD